MPLFQKTVLEKHRRFLDAEKTEAQWKRFAAHFHNPEIQQNIRNSKEEQYQEGFVDDLFTKILGYVKNPAPNYNFITEQKNEGDSKKADGAIIIGGKVRAVVELKGCDTTDLGKAEAQAFGYKNRQPGCDYVVISNFEKLRFYVENAVEHLEFNLFELTEEDFALLWLCLSHDSIASDLPLKLKNESLSTEDRITKKLYRDYSVFRRELFNDLVKKNPETDKLLLFKKTQKLLDRFLFIFFAEDRLLLPVNLIKNIISEWERLREMRVELSLYERFKLYFNDLHAGNPKQDIFAYNGGLFQPDEILDNLKVDDQLLFGHTSKLSTYDFESEVDVNILGHIFENSLKAPPNLPEGEEPIPENRASLRKKDGVFYTPKYITKYIVENTLGKLCEAKKTELEIADEIYDAAKKRSKKRLDNLKAYREWLLGLSICDPACGSGAFLNQALEFLMKEHRHLDELSAKYNEDPLILSDIENSILENNLYGVDINEESVHIAKLSLWLRTAQRNRKLNDLSQNIKCGNSLIDDPEIAGEKAFDWEKEFPKVFKKGGPRPPKQNEGGFDVVIGNPPYVSNRNIDPKLKSYYEKKYSSAFDQYDLYVLFMELAVKINIENGFSSYIVPDKFLISIYGKGVLKFLYDEVQICSYWDLTDKKIFPEASVYPIIYVFQKSATGKPGKYHLENFKEVEFEKKEDRSAEIIAKIDEVEQFKKNVWRPLSTSKNLMEGKYLTVSNNEINRYLLTYKTEKHTSTNYREKDVLTNKLLLKKICYQIEAAIDEIGVLPINTTYCILPEEKDINIKYILSLLNSKLITFYSRKKYINTSLRGGYIELRVFQIKALPLKKINIIHQQPFIEKAEKMLSLHKELHRVLGKFTIYFSGQYCLEKLPRKLENWHELGFSEFIKELNKALKKETSAKASASKEKAPPLSKKDEFGWMNLFVENKEKAQALQAEIEQADKEIDRMVYGLYGLTGEEVGVVENA